MLAEVCIGTDDLEAGGRFYDEVFATIGMKRLETVENEIGYGAPDGRVTVWIILPYNYKPATAGNGSQFNFWCETADEVKAFYDTVLKLGGTDEGPPGPRDYTPNYYGAYCRDPVGNKLHIAIKLA